MCAMCNHTHAAGRVCGNFVTNEAQLRICECGSTFIPPYMRKWDENKKNHSPIIAQKVYQSK